MPGPAQTRMMTGLNPATGQPDPNIGNSFGTNGPTTLATPSSETVNDPLASLKNSQNALTNYKYPSDLGNLDSNSKRPHYITFYINLPNNQITQETSPTQADQVNAPGTLSGPSIQPRSSILEVNLSPFQTRIGTTITLYMPDTIATNYTTAYQEDNLSENSLGLLGSMSQSVISSFKEKSFSEGMKNLEEAGLVGIGSFGQMIGGKGTFLSKLIGAVSQSPVDSILKGQGVSINPQVQLLFKGVGLRAFQFEFMFSPKNQAESHSILNIVKTFQLYSAPSLQGQNNPNTIGTLFFGLPATFQMQLMYNNKENRYMQRIRESVLESVAVDYAPNGFATFNDGSPVQIRLTLQFKETSILTRETIIESYAPAAGIVDDI
jgi:hypothetical protein